MGRGIQYSRIIFFTLVIVLWLYGVAMLGVGLWLRLDDNAWQMLDIVALGGMDDPLLRYFVYLLIGIGAFTMVVGSIGCTGVWKSNTTLLKLYTFLVGVGMLAEIVAVNLAYIFIVEIIKPVRDERTVNEEYSRGNQETLTKAIDEVQKWVPESCCKMKNKEEVENRTLCLEDAEESSVFESKYLNPKGCYQATKDWTEGIIYIFARAISFIGPIQIMSLILGCGLSRNPDAGNEK